MGPDILRQGKNKIKPRQKKNRPCISVELAALVDAEEKIYVLAGAIRPV
jgi:hypothetical protein